MENEKKKLRKNSEVNKTVILYYLVSQLLYGSTKNEIMQELNICKATFYNYIQELEDLGFEVKRLINGKKVIQYKITETMFINTLKGLYRLNKFENE